MKTFRIYRWLCFELICFWGFPNPVVMWCGFILIGHKRYRVFIGIDSIHWEWFTPAPTGGNWYYYIRNLLNPLWIERDSYGPSNNL